MRIGRRRWRKTRTCVVSAAYRAGDFSAAADDFSRQRNADADYNRGNALARQGQYEKAIGAYDDALKIARNMPDALANKKAIEEWLKQQEKKQQQQDKQDKQGQKGKKDQQSSQSQSGDAAKSSDKSQQDKQADGQQRDQDQQDQQSHDAEQSNGKQSGSKSDKPESGTEKQSAQEQAKQRQAEQQAKQQFSKNMDQALKRNDQGKPTQPKPVRLGARESNKAPDEKQQAVEQWLQRVPDDPGGLLRRKFQLEYQQRHHVDALPQGDGQ